MKRQLIASLTPSLMWSSLVLPIIDIACTDRMLGMMWYSQSKSWIEAYKAMTSFNPAYVIPGHGKPTTREVTDRDAYDYLTTLRKAVAYFMVAGGGPEQTP
jgi:hypothetical protein